MRHYYIETADGVGMGVYEVPAGAEPLDVYAQDAGYDDHEALMRFERVELKHDPPEEPTAHEVLQVAPDWWAWDDGPDGRAYIAGWDAADCHCSDWYLHALDAALDCGLLQAVRTARKQSQVAAAAAIGVDPSTLSHWETRAANPTRGLVRKALERYLLGSATSATRRP